MPDGEAVHDISDGGLSDCVRRNGDRWRLGARLLAAPDTTVPHAYWFGEDQARYIVTVAAEQAGLVQVSQHSLIARPNDSDRSFTATEVS